MNIVYFIFVSFGGKGGHFHSLHQITSEITKIEPTLKIISFGNEESEIIKTSPNFYKHLNVNKTNIISFYKNLYKELVFLNPDILHFFDAHSYNLYFPLSIFSNKKIVVNKCGGPNPKSYPWVQNLILFSVENFSWFEERKFYRNTFIKIIPNRSKKVKVEIQDNILKNPDTFNFVRICRIDSKYYHSIINGINLIKTLHKKGFNVKLYVIGKIVDFKKYTKLKDLARKYNVEFVTEDKYTTEASKMLYLADAVIGTGRSAMEACSLGIPTLMPTKSYEYPILLKEENFTNYFHKNFTERGESISLKNEKILDEIIQIIENEKTYKNVSSFSSEIFTKYFDVSIVSKKYIEFYRYSKPQKIKRTALFFNVKRTLATIYHLIRENF